MLIYATPGTGKTTFCRDNPKWYDGDNKLIDIIDQKFPELSLTNHENWGKDILHLWDKDRDGIEGCFSQYKSWLIKMKSEMKNVMFGTRRFMWLADDIFREIDPKILQSRNRDYAIVSYENLACDKWDLYYIELNGNFISNVLIKSL